MDAIDWLLVQGLCSAVFLFLSCVSLMHVLGMPLKVGEGLV